MKTPAVVYTAPGQVQLRTQLSCISSGTEGWVLHNRPELAPRTAPITWFWAPATSQNTPPTLA